MDNPTVTLKPSSHPVARRWIVVFSILLGLCVVYSIISIPVKSTLLQPDFYIRILDGLHFSERMPELLASSLVETKSDNSNNLNLFSKMDPTKVETLLTILIPDGWLETQENTVIRATLDYINLKSDTVSVTINLQPIKDNLSTPAAEQAITGIITGFPDCNGDQINLILTGIQSGQNGIEFCNPPVSDLPLLNFLLGPISNRISAAIPSAMLFPSSKQTELLKQYTSTTEFQVYRFLRRGMDVVPYICLLLLIGIILLSLHSKEWMTTALGLPLFIAGFITSIPGVWIILANSPLAAKISTSSSFSAFAAFQGLIQDVGQEILISFGQHLLIWSLGVLVLGLVLIGVRVLLKK